MQNYSLKLNAAALPWEQWRADNVPGRSRALQRLGLESPVGLGLKGAPWAREAFALTKAREEQTRMRTACDRWRKSLVSCFGSYLQETSVPGVAYMQYGTPWLQRLFWLSALVVAMCLWAALAAPQWTRWREAPVVITMETAPRVVTALPMPAITICTTTPNIYVDFDYMEMRRRFIGDTGPPPSPVESQTMQDIAQLCFNYELLVGTSELNLSRSKEEVAEQFGAHNFSYRYIDDHGTSKNVGKTLGMRGMCYVFNSAPGVEIFRQNTFHAVRRYVDLPEVRSTWHPDDGYAATESDEYPERALGAGEHFGYELIVNFTQVGKGCYDHRVSVDVALHPPTEVRSPSSVRVVLEPQSELAVALTPHVVHTSANLRWWYSAKQRQCYFADEKRLRFFAFYSQTNCEYECLSNLTLHHCGCVPFYFPRGPEAPPCLYLMGNCYFEMLDLIGNDTATAHCDCLPSCNELDYRAEYTKSQAHLGDIASIKLYYPRKYFLSYARTEVFGIVDLIATVGGLLGLFVGISMLSAAELLFWIIKLFIGQRRTDLTAK